jgi:hypothetical protein
MKRLARLVERLEVARPDPVALALTRADRRAAATLRMRQDATRRMLYGKLPPKP